MKNQSSVTDDLKILIETLSTEIQSDIVLYAGPLERPGDIELISRCRERRHKKALLLLATYGGDAHSAYRIARYFQRCYDSFSVYIHTVCKSAGTLLALGANEIIMSDYAEIGPLDVQLQKDDELGARSSGLAITQALSTLTSQAFDMFEDYFLQLRFRSGGQITTRSAAGIAAKLTVGLVDPIFAQIDPIRLGEINRAIRIAYDYGVRIGSKNLKPEMLERLVAGYPDHSFVIDRKEAEELFNSIRKPTETEIKLANLLQSLMHESLQQERPVAVNFMEVIEVNKEAEKRIRNIQRKQEKKVASLMRTMGSPLPKAITKMMTKPLPKTLAKLNDRKPIRLP